MWNGESSKRLLRSIWWKLIQKNFTIPTCVGSGCGDTFGGEGGGASATIASLSGGGVVDEAGLGNPVGRGITEDLVTLADLSPSGVDSLLCGMRDMLGCAGVDVLSPAARAPSMLSVPEEKESLCSKSSQQLQLSLPNLCSPVIRKICICFFLGSTLCRKVQICS